MAVGAVLDDMPNREERLLVALACSLVLHLGLLVALSGYLESEKKSAPEPEKLTARLVEPRPPEASKLAEPAPPSPAPAPKAARPARPKPVPRAQEVVPPVIALPPTPAAPPAPVVAPAPQPAAPPLAAVPAPPAPEQGPAAGPDSGSVAQFRMALIELARRYKRYPRAAVDNNWEGKVELRMVIAANGSIASLSVRRSAGYAALDEEARRMFRAAKGELAVPPALRGKEFSVDLSADFYFKE